MKKPVKRSRKVIAEKPSPTEPKVDNSTGQSDATIAAAGKTGPVRVLLDFKPEDRALLQEVRERMIPSEQTAILNALRCTNHVITRQNEGYKLAMVKDDHVEAVQIFF